MWHCQKFEDWCFFQSTFFPHVYKITVLSVCNSISKFMITVLCVPQLNFWDHCAAACTSFQLLRPHYSLRVLSLQLYRSQCCLCAPSFQLLRPQCCLCVPHFKLWGKIAVCVYTISTFGITVLSACAPISTFSITNAVSVYSHCNFKTSWLMFIQLGTKTAPMEDIVIPHSLIYTNQ